MGAEFISLIFIGPTYLSESARRMKKAEKRVRYFIEKAIRHIELVRAVDGTDDSLSKEQEKKINKEIEEIRSDPAFRDFDIQYEDCSWVFDYKRKPESLIKSLFSIWAGGSYDTSCRRIPGDEKRKVVVAGGTSWGDEPDTWGYNVLKRADQCGLLKIFDIE